MKNANQQTILTTPAILAGVVGLRAQHIGPTGIDNLAYWRI